MAKVLKIYLRIEAQRRIQHQKRRTVTIVHKARKLKDVPPHKQMNLRTDAPTVQENKDGRYVEFMGVKASVLGGGIL